MVGLFRKTAAVAVVLAGSAGSAFGADKVTFQFDWLPGGDKAPIFVCVAKGICAKEGLDIKIASGRGSSDAITKLSTGASDMGSAGVTALMAAAARDDRAGPAA